MTGNGSLLFSREVRALKRLKRNAVKEAFDNLPCGVCFFDMNGMVTLCNYQMHRLVFALTGRDLQSFSELNGFLSANTEKNEHNVFTPDDGSVWQFSQEIVAARDGRNYIQVLAADVTELYHRQKELEQDNRRLEEYARRMRRLSKNIKQLIREEEILNMKMRVHDDIGRSVIATRQFLEQGRPMEELDLTVWKNAVKLLKHDSELAEERGSFDSLMSAAKSIGVHIIIDGDFSGNTSADKLVVAAVRECMTNAVRHAHADELYVKLNTENGKLTANISNNGDLPKKKITEGGGLSSLRARIESNGGEMKVSAKNGFELFVNVPIKKEITL